MNFICKKSDEEITATGLTVAQVKVLVGKLKIADLETRPIYIDVERADNEKLPNNAVIVSTSYPFGSKRCVRVLFSEWRDKHGYRTVTATSNKFHVGWNACKNGTYTMGVSYFTWDELNHVQCQTFGLYIHDAAYYARKDFESGFSNNRDRIESFKNLYAGLYSAGDEKFLRFYLRLMDKETERLSIIVE